MKKPIKIELLAEVFFPASSGLSEVCEWWSRNALILYIRRWVDDWQDEGKARSSWTLKLFYQR